MFDSVGSGETCAAEFVGHPGGHRINSFVVSGALLGAVGILNRVTSILSSWHFKIISVIEGLVFGYSQPSAYHFSHDSIELAARAVALLSRENNVGRFRGLDLCAGCGVVGFEILRGLYRGLKSVPPALRPMWEADFTEVQSVYLPHFEVNRDRFLSEFPTVPAEVMKWRPMNYAELLTEPNGQYDWIVSNPPYFDPVQGKLPPSEFKARCRFFIDSDFETLCRSVAHALAPKGLALLLVRDLSDPVRRRQEILDRVFNTHGSWLELEPVRGTSLIQVRK